MLLIYKRRLIAGLIALQLVFILIFILGFINYQKGVSILHTGLQASIENLAIMLFSILSMINVVYELTRIK